MKDTIDAATWTLNDSWDNMGIEISELQRVEEPAIDNSDVVVPHYAPPKKPNTAALDAWAANQARRKSVIPVWVVVLLIVMAGITLVSIMVSNADATMAFMEMTVTKIEDKLITVTNDDGDDFVFDYLSGTQYKVGDKVMIVTDIVYQGNDVWYWTPDRTGIVPTE